VTGVTMNETRGRTNHGRPTMAIDPRPNPYQRDTRGMLLHKLLRQDRVICGMSRHAALAAGGPVPGPCLTHDHSEDLGA
jgi:hypothetical protein